MSELQAPVLMNRVKYELQYTKNLGNFENVKILVGLEQDGTGHPDANFKRVREWVEDNLGIASTEVVAALEESSE